MRAPRKSKAGAQPRKPPKMRGAAQITGQCLCGAVEIEIDVPVFWAWHDHSAPSRRVHGAAYATDVGCWRSKVRVAKGDGVIRRFEEAASGNGRSFCSLCGTPLMYERKRSPRMVNLPRALFAGRTGREAKYHIAIGELQDWAYLGAPVGPLKGYPGVSVERGKKKAARSSSLFDIDA
jgi:hypothetical protein